MRLAFFILFCSMLANAATFYVRTDGNDSNTGTANTSGAAWLTIGKAESTMAAGDTVRVADGIYNERVTINASGTVGNFINYIGNATGTGVVSFGFACDSVSFVRIIGMEIRHTSTTHTRGISISGSCTNLQFIDNYFHDTHWSAISSTAGSVSYDIIIRGNIMDYIAHPGSLQDADGAIVNGGGGSHRWLAEYNTISRSGDFLNLYGSNSISRNNFLHHYANALWLTNGFHTDGLQCGSDGQQLYMRNQLHEANLIVNLRDSHAADGLDGHVGIFQDNAGNGDTNVLVRRIVGAQITSGGLTAFGTDGALFIHNTLHQFSIDYGGGGIIIFGGGGSLDGFIGNNIISSNGFATDALLIDGGHTGTLTNNLGFNSNSESSYVSTSDPLFASPAAYDFKIGASSPAKDTGTTNVCWITSATGSGTSFDVNDGRFIRDGDGLTEGDQISFGATTARVMDVTGNTVTVASSVSWVQGNAVFYGTDTTPDIGAIPNSAIYLTAATYSVGGSTATVSTTGDARKVWQYRGGIPIAEDYDTPFTFSHTAGDVYRAYALWPQSTLIVNATASGEPGQPGIGGGVIVGSGGFHGNGGFK